VFETGSSTDGCALGFNPSGDLIWRAGSGADPATVPNDIARIVVPAADVPKDRQIKILCDIRCDGVNSGRVRLWIDGVKYGEDQTDDASVFTVFATTSNGGVNGFQGSVVTGEGSGFGGALNAYVTLNSDLRYWHNTLVDDALEITGSDQLALRAGKTFGAYRYTFDLGSELFGRLFIEADAEFLAADELEVSEALMEVFDATFPITQAFLGIPGVRFVAEFPTEVPLPPGGRDFQFESVVIRVEFWREANDETRPAINTLTTKLHQPVEMS
jgi:hypothetical protein